MDQIARPFDTVTVFGGAAIDRIARSTTGLVLGASNPGTVQRIAGGAGFNVATVLARLGLKTKLVTCVGDDSDGDAVISAARFAGVDTSAISVAPGAPTAGYYATFDEAGNLVVGIADMDICKQITPAAVASIAVESSDHDFWVVDANLPPETLAFLAAEAVAVGRQIAALTVSPAKAAHWVPLLDQLSYVFANRSEAAALVGRDAGQPGATATRLASELAQVPSARFVITNGEKPLATASAGETRSYAVLRAQVKMVNGAGDSLAAGTIHGLALGRALNDAILLGLAAAALSIESGGVLAAPFSATSLAARIGTGPEWAFV